jgi:Family of unknown function (DUF6459)
MSTVTRLHRSVPFTSVQGSLALEVEPHTDPPAAPPPTVPPVAAFDVVPVATTTRAQLEAWARRYGQAVAEIATGDRPAAQVVRWSTPRVYDDLVRRAVLITRAAGQPAPGSGRHRRTLARPQVRGVRISFVAGHIVEASFHVRYGDRSRAIAARFEVLDERWQCSALEFA